MNTTPMAIKEFGREITWLLDKKNLSRQRSKELFYQVLLNLQPDLQQGAFLSALRAKGETIEEIAGSWEAIYELDTVKIKPEVPDKIYENCGTGMDSFKTFNISTAAAVIAAASGMTMARHGSRAVSSACGTIDLLEELGIEVECEPELVKTSIETIGIGIFNGSGSKVHPQALGRILSQIAFGTTFNIAASLANPAAPKYAVRGVYCKDLILPVIRVMKEIGYVRALVMFGEGADAGTGMDEASTIGETYVAELKENGDIIRYSFTPESMGIARPDPKELLPLGDRQSEAKRLLAILKGQGTGACRDIVCLNAGLLLYLGEKALSIRDGYHLAKEIIEKGMAMEKMRAWVKAQNTNPIMGVRQLESHLVP